MKCGKNGFDMKLDAARFGGSAAAQALFAGEMDDIAGGAGIFEKSGEAVGAFGFDGFRAAGLVPLGAGLALGEQFLLQAAHQFGVFAVRGDDDAESFGELERLVHLAVVNAEEVLVSEEDFERRDAVGHDLAELGFGFVVEFGDGHVESVVAGAVAFGFGFPELITFQRIVIARGAAHFDIGGGAADQRRDAGGFVRIFGEGRHEGQIDVDVGIDEAGENQFAGGIDDFGAGGDFEVLADAGDGFVFDVDVGGGAGAAVTISPFLMRSGVMGASAKGKIAQGEES